MKSLITCCLILLTGTAALADVEAFHFSQGQFDAKHFDLHRSPKASLKINSEVTTAYLKITESSCRDQGSGCTDMARTRLNQTFKLLATQTDACNITTYKSVDRPSSIARSRFDRAPMMMVDIELRDARLSTCKRAQNPIQVVVHTHTFSSAGISTLQFQAQDADIAQEQNSNDPVIRGESFLLSGI